MATTQLNSQCHNETNSTDDHLNYTEEIICCEDYVYIDYLLRSIWMYAGYPVLVLGTVGHVLVIVLLLLNKGMRSLPLSIFLLTMSASGLMALYVGLLPTIIKHQTCRNVAVEDLTSETGCRFIFAAIYFSLQLYSWMEASVAVERMCAVRWALTYRNVATPRHNVVATAVIIIVLIAINGIHFKIYGTSKQNCDVEDLKLFNAWQYIHVTVYIVFPVALMLSANAVTLHTMYRSPLKNSSNVRKAKPIAITMFILNVIFIVTTTPILVGHYEDLDQSQYEAVQVAWAVSQLMMYLGCSLTFIVYVAVAARFRKALSELLVSGKNRLCFAVAFMSNRSVKTKSSIEFRVAEVAGSSSGRRFVSSSNSTTEGQV